MRPLIPFAVGLVMLVTGVDGVAHGGVDPVVGDGLPGWTFDPWVTAPLAASALLFSAGWIRLRARSRQGRDGWRRRGIVFAAGWSVIAMALVSPLHAAGERSFALHMVEHEVLMLLGAPLLVLAEPLVVLLWALPSAWRRSLGERVNRGAPAVLWQRATEPFTATALQAAALWLWHAPALFDLALSSDGWHAAQHLTFLVSALLFWTAVSGAMSQRRARTNAGVAALCLFATSLVSGALGALMALSESPWYAGYARLPMAPFGLTPVEDQQLAGLLMWIPGGLVHAGVALAIVRGLFTAAGAREADAA